jgi:hypothetical protein
MHSYTLFLARTDIGPNFLVQFHGRSGFFKKIVIDSAIDENKLITIPADFSACIAKNSIGTMALDFSFKSSECFCEMA